MRKIIRHCYRGIRCGTGQEAHVESTARAWTPKKGQTVRKEVRK